MKTILTKLHRWIGLITLLFLTMSGLTGIFLAYMPELDAWLNRDVIELHEAGTQVLPFKELAKAVEEKYQGAKVSGVFIGEEANNSYLFTLKSKAPLTANQVWVNPYTAEILGDRYAGKAHFDRRHIMPFMLELHRRLLLDKTGEAIMGFVALAWFLLVLAGIYLALHKRGIKAALTVSRAGSAFRTLFDLHRAVGLCLCVVFIGSSIAAMSINFPDEFRAIVRVFSPLPDAPVKRLPVVAKAPINIEAEQAMRIAQQEFPSAHLTALSVHPDKGAYQVRFRLPDDVNIDNGTARVLVSTTDGRVMAKVSYRDTQSAGETFAAWMFPVHSGQGFGAIGRFVIALVGLLVPTLGWTGFYFWYRREKMMKKAARMRKPAVA